jgi:4-amino-4-deoxy-L-arabinose transferase-like glycosyltransferase
MADLTEGKPSRRQWLAGAGLLAASLGLHLWSLMRFPAPFVDEAWLVSRAWAFIQTGQAFGPLDSGLADHFEGYWTLNQWLITLLHSLGLRVWGAPDLVAVRGVSLIFGLALLAAVYVIGRQLGGIRLGWLSALLVSLSMPFLLSAHLARYDILTAAFGFWAIALHFIRRNSHWTGLLSGLCLGLAFETHAHSMIYAPAILVLYWWDFRWAMFRQKHFWGFIVGGALGLLYYAALHVLPYPQTFLAVNQLTFGATRTPPILTLNLRVILQAFDWMANLLLALYSLMIVIILLAVVMLFRKRTRANQLLLVLSLTLVLLFTLIVRHKHGFYSILTTPVLDMLVAAFLLDFIRKPWRGQWTDYASRSLVWSLVIGALVFSWSAVLVDSWPQYQVTADRIKQSIRPGESIMADQVYWFSLQDHSYYSWDLLYLYQRYKPGSTVQDGLREFRPDIFIIDRHMSLSIADPDPQDEAYQQHWLLSRPELESFLSQRAQLLDAFDSSLYGNIRVYRINWKE